MIEKMKWVGERVHIQHHLYDPTGIRETIILYPKEALDILFWLYQERDKLQLIYAQQLQNEENIS